MNQEYYNAIAQVEAMENTIQPNKAEEKAQRLAEKRAAKLAKMGVQADYTNLSNTTTVLPTGTIESNKNKVWNTLTDEELQYLTGYATSKYYVPEEELTSSTGRRFYQYMTKDEKVKTGISTGGANTSDVRYDNTIDPKYNQPWRHSHEEGPDLNNKLIDQPMQFNAATTLEGLHHGNKRLLDNRKFKDYLSDKALAQPGGVSEYYDTNAKEYWGDSSKSTMTDDTRRALETYFDQIVQDKDGPDKLEEYNKSILENRGIMEQVGDEVENAAKSFVVGFYDEAISKPAAWLEEMTIGRQETEEERTARVDNIFGIGYDRQKATVKGLERQKLNKVFDDPKASTRDKINAGVEIIGNAVTDGSLIGSSFGVLAAWVLPGSMATKGAKGAQKLAQIDKLIDAGKLTKVQGAAQKTKYLGSTREGIKTALKSQAGMINAAVGNLNQQYDEWVENNNGKEYEGGRTQWMIERAPIQLINQNLDKITDTSILKSPQLLRGLKDVIGGATDKQMVKFLGGVTKTVGSTAFVQMPKEAAQEYIQSTMEAFNTRYGTEKFDNAESFIEFVQDPRNYTEARLAGIEGAGGAAQFQAVGTTINGMNKVKDKIIAPPADVEALQAEIGSVTSAPTPDGMKQAVKIMKKNMPELDKNAPEKQAYDMVFAEALKKANDADDPKTLQQIAETMRSLDADKDSSFDLQEYTKGEMAAAYEQFAKIVNSSMSVEDTAELKTATESVRKQLKEKHEQAVIDSSAVIAKQLSGLRGVLNGVQGSKFDGTKTKVDGLQKAFQDFIDGKGLDSVAEEAMKLGFTDFDPNTGKAVVDDRRPGVSTYEVKLNKLLTTTDTQNKLLKVNAAGGVTLNGFSKYASSRLDKLSTGTVFNSSKLLSQMKTENENIAQTADDLLTTVDQMEGVTTENKSAYKEVLTQARNKAETALDVVTRREEVVNEVKARYGVDAGVAYEVENGIETVQLWKGTNSPKEVLAVIDNDGQVQFSNRPMTLKKQENKLSPDVIDKEVLTQLDSKMEQESASIVDTTPGTTTENRGTIEPPREPEITNQWINASERTFPYYISSRGDGGILVQEPSTETGTKKDPTPLQPVDMVGLTIQDKTSKIEYGVLSKDGVEIKAINKATGKVEIVVPDDDKYTILDTEIADIPTRLKKLKKEVDAVIDSNLADIDNKFEEVTGDKSKLAGYGVKVTTLQEVETINKNIRTLYKRKRTKLREEIATLRVQRDSELKKADKLKVGADRSFIKKIKVTVEKFLKEIKSLITKHKDRLKEDRANKIELTTMLNEVENSIKAIERAYDTVAVGNKQVKVGKATKTESVDNVHGKAYTEIKQGRSRVRVKADAKSTEKKIAVSKVVTSEKLGDKLVNKILKNLVRAQFKDVSANMFKRTKDGMFGQVTEGKLFDKSTEEIVELMPKKYKEFFMKTDTGKQEITESLDMIKKMMSTLKDDVVINKDWGIRLNEEGTIQGKKIKGGNDELHDIIQLLTGDVDSKLEVKGQPNYKTKLPPQLAEVIKFHAIKMMMDMEKTRTNLVAADMTDIKKDFGVDEDQAMLLQNNARSGKIPTAGPKRDAGKAVYDQLGIKLARESAKMNEASMIAGLGALVQAYAASAGVIKEGSTETMKGKTMEFDTVVWEAVVRKNELRNAKKAIGLIQYMTEAWGREQASTEAVVHTTNPKIMGSNYDVEDEAKEFINKYNKIGYTISDRFAKIMDKYDSREMSWEQLLVAHGYKKDSELVGQMATDVLKAKAVNDKIERELNTLIQYYRAAGTDTKLYTTWGQTVSKRYTILGDLNYQESKLHREYLRANKPREVELLNDTSGDLLVLKAGISQALDLDPDKISKETMETQFDELIELNPLDGVIIKGDSKEAKILKEALEAISTKEGAETMAKVFHEFEGHHALTALQTLKDMDAQLKAGKTTVETELTVEADAITSGMILTAMQLGTDMAMELAEKGGVYSDEALKKWTNYVEKFLGKTKEGKDYTFSPGALIEAGKVHMKILEPLVDAEVVLESAKIVNEGVKEAQAEFDNAKKDVARQLGELGIKEDYPGYKQMFELTSNMVFKDMYMSMGVHMLKVIAGKKASLEKEIKTLKGKDLIKAQRLLELINSVGKLNMKKVRSIAKDPVMVYIYGASTNTIKGNLVRSIGIGTLKDKIVEEKDHKLLKMYLGEVNGKVRIDDKTPLMDYGGNRQQFVGMAKTPDGQDVYRLQDADGKEIARSYEKVLLMLNLYDTKLYNSLKSDIFDTFGSAIDVAFETTKAIDDNRNVIKTNEVLTYEAHKVLLEDKLNSVLGTGTKKEQITTTEMNELIEALRDAGQGHDTIWKDKEEGRTVYQPLDSRSNENVGHSSVEVNGKKRGAGTIIKTDAANPGAAAVIPIHATDGELMRRTLSKLLADGIISENVYDAVLMEINTKTVEAMNESYNTETIKVGFGKSILVDNVQKLGDMLKAIEEKGLIDKLIEGLVNPDSIGSKALGQAGVKKTKEITRLYGTARKATAERVKNSEKKRNSGHSHVAPLEVIKGIQPVRSKEWPIEAGDRVSGLVAKLEVARDKYTVDKLLEEVTNELVKIESSRKQSKPQSVIINYMKQIQNSTSKELQSKLVKLVKRLSDKQYSELYTKQVDKINSVLQIIEKIQVETIDKSAQDAIARGC